MSTRRVLSIFTLAMINLAAVLSIKNWPITAEYGLSSITYYVIAALFFFLPVSFVSAELATGWPERGGVFVWVKEALGHKAGFLAIWLLWIENVIALPTTLSFIAGSLAFAFMPSLANNALYTFAIVVVVFWSISLVNFLGMKASGLISSASVILGTILPGIFIIGIGLLWFFGGNVSHIEFSMKGLIPNLSSVDNISFLVGIFLGLAGMEMSAVHAKDVLNPQKNYPRAIFASAAVIIAMSILGTLAIAVIVPQNEIVLHAGAMEAISFFLKSYNLDWMIPVMAILIVVGALGLTSTWAAGPSRGLLAAAQNGDFPPILHTVNKHNMPVAMLIFQAIVLTVFSAVFIFMPNVNIAFWTLMTLASQLYLVMYVMMFISGIVLRYKKPHVKRAYKIPGGNFGMWFVSCIGILSAIFAFAVGFFPPSQISSGDVKNYEFTLLVSIAVSCLIPYIILMFKKPSWDKVVPYQDVD